MLTANILKMPLPGQRLTTSLLCTLLMMTSVFMTAPEYLFVKPCINSTYIPLLLHGFMLVKTWLLIVCGTAFYAINEYFHMSWLIKDVLLNEQQ